MKGTVAFVKRVKVCGDRENGKDCENICGMGNKVKSDSSILFCEPESVRLACINVIYTTVGWEGHE